MGLGRFAAPVTLGGGMSPAEQVWRALRAAEGTHVGGEDSLEDDWRKAIATALAAAESSVERAVIQFFPEYADDLLERYEEVLGILPVPTDTRTARREAAAAEWHRRGRADLPTLEEELQAAFSAAWTIEHVDDPLGSTLPGRRLSPAGLEATEPRTHQNYSTAYFVRARYSDPDPPSLAEVRAVRAFLDARIGAWCMPLVLWGAAFTLDGDPLDITPLG